MGSLTRAADATRNMQLADDIVRVKRKYEEHDRHQSIAFNFPQLVPTLPTLPNSARGTTNLSISAYHSNPIIHHICSHVYTFGIYIKERNSKASAREEIGKSQD